MKKLQFKTNSRHISQLGRELVTDFVTALVEEKYENMIVQSMLFF